MPEQYDAAALRHYKDAETLAQAERFDNASHLIGFSAECAIKHAFAIANIPNAKVHLPDLAAIAIKRLQGRSASQIPLFNLISRFNNTFFSNWNISHRYFEDHITADQYYKWKDITRRTLSAAHLNLIER